MRALDCRYAADRTSSEVAGRGFARTNAYKGPSGAELERNRQLTALEKLSREADQAEREARHGGGSNIRKQDPMAQLEGRL